MKTKTLPTAAMAALLALAACAPADTGEPADGEMAEAEMTGAETAAAEEAAVQDAMADEMAASTVQSELLADLAGLRDKYLGLAEAMTGDAWEWRPGEGVRSTPEVFMHVASANFRILAGVVGAPPPEGADPAWMGDEAESVTDPAAVSAALAASFDYIAEVVGNTSEEEMARPLQFFGNQSSVRGALVFTLAHCHEHLGQTIAYARTNSIAPPWSM